MSEDLKGIKEKIRKLKAHMESAKKIGSEEEAQAFAAKVQELLTAYKLREADIGTGADPEEPINTSVLTWQEMGLKVRRSRIGWAERLAHLCAHAYYCDFVVASDRHFIGWFVGAGTDRDMCRFMFVSLGRFLENEADRQYNREFYRHYVPGVKSTVRHVRGFRAGFMIGFLTRLRQRFEEEVRPKDKTPEASIRTEAIVLVRRNAMARVEAWMREHFPTTPCGRTTMDGGSYEGRKAGFEAADAINLRPNPIERAGKRQGSLR